MQVTVIDGCGIYDEFASVLRDCFIQNLNNESLECKIISLDKLDITPCIGCLDCWFKNPGKCRFEDDMETVMKEQVNCDFIIYLGDVIFGSFTSTLKVGIDRSVSMFQPFFIKERDETHHVLRYPPKKGIYFIGILPKESIEEVSDTFIRYVKKMQKEMPVANTATLLLHRESDATKECARMRTIMKEELLCKL